MQRRGRSEGGFALRLAVVPGPLQTAQGPGRGSQCSQNSREASGRDACSGSSSEAPAAGPLPTGKEPLLCRASGRAAQGAARVGRTLLTKVPQVQKPRPLPGAMHVCRPTSCLRAKAGSPPSWPHSQSLQPQCAGTSSGFQPAESCSFSAAPSDHTGRRFAYLEPLSCRAGMLSSQLLVKGCRSPSERVGSRAGGRGFQASGRPWKRH